MSAAILTPGYTGVSSDTGDLVAVVLYFVVIVLIWIYATFREYKDTASGHILGGRSVRWVQIGASLFVCNIGSEQFFGLTQSAAENGISMGAREFSSILVIQLLCWIFVPVYMACGVSTTPEYLSKRFGGRRLRVLFAMASIALYIITKLSVELYVASVFHSLIHQSYWPYTMTYILLAIVKMLVGVKQLGNMKPISIIDPFHSVVTLIGAIVVMGYAFSTVGGLEGLYKEYARSTGGRKLSFQLLGPVGDDYMPWLGFLLGQTPGFIWYWCADQYIVQRLLVAKSISHAQGAGLMVGVLKVLPFFLMVLPGMISKLLHPAVWPPYAYPKLLHLMPSGLRGLMFAVLLVCSFSNISYTLDTLTAIFAVDFWNVVRKDASAWELHRAKRLCFVVVNFMSIGWMVLVMTTRGDLLTYIQAMTSYLAPPFAAIFLMGVFVPRTTEKGAFWALVLGSLTGAIRLILSMIDNYLPFNTEAADKLIVHFHYMYFGLFSFLLTIVVAFAISLLSHPPEGHRIGRTTFWTRKSEQQDEMQLTDFDELAENQSADLNRTGFEATSRDSRRRTPISPEVADTASFDCELIFVEANSHPEGIRRRLSDSQSSDSDLIIAGEDNQGRATPCHGTAPQGSDNGVTVTEEDIHGGPRPRHWTAPQGSDNGVTVTEEDIHGGARPRHWTAPQGSDNGVTVTEEDIHGGARPRHWTGPQSSNSGVIITDEDGYREGIRRYRIGLHLGDVPFGEESNHGVALEHHASNPQISDTVDQSQARMSSDTLNSQLSMFCDSWRNPPTARQAGDYKKTFRRRVSRFFKMRSPDEVKQRQLKLHIQKISELRQSKMAKTGLGVGLVLVVLTGVFLFLFWSFWSPYYAAQL